MKSVKFVLKHAHFPDQKGSVAQSEPFGNWSLSGKSLVAGRDGNRMECGGFVNLFRIPESDAE